ASRRTVVSPAPARDSVSISPRWWIFASCVAREETRLIGLMSLRPRELPPVPKFDKERARFVREKSDQILQWEQSVDRERDTRFVDLGRYLCEVRSGQYWRLERLASFDDFLERRFPQSRRKAYYLMSIQE